MRVILTGFEPFGGESINPSQCVIEALSAERIPGIQLLCMILPVVYGIAEERLAEAITDLQPDAVISLGQSGGSTALKLERVAINVRLTSATDPAITHSALAGSFNVVSNQGERTLMETEVVLGGPPAYFSTLPVWELLQKMRDAGIPAIPGYAAGTHLCNSTLYYTLHHLATHHQQQHTQAGFIHLPYLPQQSIHLRDLPPSMALDTQVAGIRTALLALAGE